MRMQRWGELRMLIDGRTSLKQLCMPVDGSTSLERLCMPVDGNTVLSGLRGLIAPGFMQRDTGIVQKQPM